MSHTMKVVPSPSGVPPLDADLHARYVRTLDDRKDEHEYWLTEHLRMSGIYWALVALHMLRRPDELPRDKLLDFVLSCWQPNGGFSAAPDHDAHLLFTVSAVQILVMLDGWRELDAMEKGGKTAIAQYIANLQNRASGTFAGDEWGETDTRFLYGALNALSLLGHMHLIDLDQAVQHVKACQNIDGAFGTTPGAESHSGQVFTCVGALAIADRLDLIDVDKLGAWLSERQLPNGGLNGRPEKLEDVCYGWWVMSSMAMIKRLHWIDRDKMVSFILSCQDPEGGGFADRPEDMVDVFHTCFALTGLSLLGFEGLEQVDPRYCMPMTVLPQTIR
ncbi:geranylgeranyltransferase beta subunit [Myriangium duriaei CBS 260.36]|uniref:Geranylgeranyl transferase type-2 subunit beta n=1 Tax=Myriangium duriaei CBS 260.36 TaxID=1168546 RepID=A0A9P4J8X1_9PEZI|nr:geranylgeranyltransferase beta subunit [Myriangium duriaei CBS 260.36]